MCTCACVRARACVHVCFILGIKICSVSLRILVYFGVFLAGFDPCLEMKSVFLVSAILDRLDNEDSCGCF